MFKTEIIKEMDATSYGSRSYSKTVYQAIKEQGKEQEVATAVQEVVAISMATATPVTNTARKVSTRVHHILSLELPNDHSLLHFGTITIHWLAEAGLLDVEKITSIDDDKVRDQQWFIVSLSEEFTDYAQHIAPEKLMLSPTTGHKVWTEPKMKIGQYFVPIVKKAERIDKLHTYTTEQMPDVYKALNRLGKQAFNINEDILMLAKKDFSFIPETVTEGQRKRALHSINDITRKAKFIEEIRFQEMNKWLLEEAEVEDEAVANKISKKKASEKSQDWYDTKVEPHSEVISKWSKRTDFERTVELADLWNGSAINYTFNCDFRGRIYAIQNYLTPLGSDFAKALLVFEEYHQVSGYDLCIHIANCFGQDKLSFEMRVDWVNDNAEALRSIGIDPMSSSSEISALDLASEAKTRWQGVAACQVYETYCLWVEANDTEEGFTTNLVIGLDSTSSGTQILTLLGADDRVAPYVNLTKSETGAVGDFYTFLSTYLQPKLEEHRGQSLTLDAVLNNWKKHARKLSKRNSMTFSYSGTKFGFGQQHWEDRHSYGAIGSDLTRSDCRILGNEMYEVCVENIRGGAEIMEWLRGGVDYHNDGAVISWTLPDGFIVYQTCDASKRSSLKTTIGSRNLQLVYYTFQDKPKKVDHKNGISPNFVHSLDAYMLRLIVNGMPEEAPISTVHDMFSTSSYFIQDLQEVAKEAYKKVGSRDEAERMAKEAFGIHRDLPLVGTYNINQIDEAEFIIC